MNPIDDFWLRAAATIPAAIIATITAISATWATHLFAARRARRNLLAGLSVELAAIEKELLRVVELGVGNTHVACRTLDRGKDACPIFFANTAAFSMVQTPAVEKIYSFYSQFLTVPSRAGADGALLYAKRDIEVLAESAHSARISMGV